MSKPLTLLSLKYCFTKIKNENPCASFYDELFSSYRKRDKRRKEEKSWEAHKYHSQNAGINLITFGISVEIYFNVLFNTGSMASVHMK